MNPQYLETFKNKVPVIDSYGGAIGTDPGLAKEELSVVVNPTDPDKQSVAEAAKNKCLGVVMLCGSDQGRYGNLVEDLQKYFFKGNYDYPVDATEA